MSEGDVDLAGNLYKERFDPAADKGDLEAVAIVARREARLDGLRGCLREWRPVALQLAQVAEWRRPWFPAVLVGGNTLLFLLVGYLHLSTLSTLALLGVLVTLADALVPLVSATLFDTATWSDEQERELEGICARLLAVREQGDALWANLQRLKAGLPRTFSLALCGVFILLAILFDKVNNTLLLYLLSTGLLLAPGLLARNVPQLARHHTAQLLGKLKRTRQSATVTKTTKQN